MKLIVNFAPTGMIPTKKMTPYVPVSVEEIVENVLEAVNIGITMVHLHARDEQNGEPTYKASVYGRIIEGIRRYAPDLVIGVSTSGRTYNQFEKRIECLQLEGHCKPDMASLTLSSLNFNQQASINDPDMIKSLALEMQRRDIIPELEVFDVGMINYARYLEKKELIRPPYYFNLICGNIACAQADLLHIGMMLRDLPPDSLWSLGGVGDSQVTVNSIAIVMGGGVRVGLEDNIWYDPQRERLATNADLIRRIHRLAEDCGREVMTPLELRALLKMGKKPGQYGRVATGAASTGK